MWWFKKETKLKGMPKVYYFNLDKDTERQKFMEGQFHKYGIKYKRISQSKYTFDNLSEWIYKFEDHQFMLENLLPDQFIYPGNLISHLEFFKQWLKTSNDDYLLVMEDDYDLSLIDYWHFDWKYLVDHLPIDWDAIKLNDDHMYTIKFFLHPQYKGTFSNFGAMLFQRSFVQRIVSMLYNSNDQIKSYENRSLRDFNMDYNIADRYCVDKVLVQLGSIYMAPLITTEASLCADATCLGKENSSKDVFYPIQNACHHWWRNERDLYTLDDFFTYGKPSDQHMTVTVRQIRSF